MTGGFQGILSWGSPNLGQGVCVYIDNLGQLYISSAGQDAPTTLLVADGLEHDVLVTYEPAGFTTTVYMDVLPGQATPGNVNSFVLNGSVQVGADWGPGNLPAAGTVISTVVINNTTADVRVWLLPNQTDLEDTSGNGADLTEV